MEKEMEKEKNIILRKDIYYMKENIQKEKEMEKEKNIMIMVKLNLKGNILME